VRPCRPRHLFRPTLNLGLIPAPSCGVPARLQRIVRTDVLLPRSE
jgi:hypothetical protein